MSFNLISVFPGFYLRAVTQYQLHSPFVFELVRAVLEDRRHYYAFDDIEQLRQRLLRAMKQWYTRIRVQKPVNMPAGCVK